MTKDDIYKKLAVDMELPVEVVEKVVSWSYMKANQAVRHHKEIEVTGLGKFFISPAKAKRRMQAITTSLQNPMIVDTSRETLKQELEFIQNQLGEQVQGISPAPTEGSEEPR